MSLEPAFRPRSAHASKPKALVVYAHLRPGRDKRRTTYLMPPIICAKLDRLSRDVHYISGLMKHRVPFIVAA
jgi:hypothetical protein